MIRIDTELLKILACPICRSGVKSSGKYLVCTNKGCGLRFPVIDGIPMMLPHKLNKDLKLTQKKWSEEYKNNYNLKTIGLSNDPELRDAYKHVKKYMKSRSRLFLEAGCGLSKLSCLLAKEGIKTIGIDLSLNALLMSNELFKKEGVKGSFVCGDMLNMPFKDYVFSFVYTGGVLEHFKNNQKAVNELFRCLALNGFTTNTVPYLSFSTPYRMLRWGNIPDIFLLRNIIEFIEIELLKEKRLRFGYEKSFSARKMRKIFENAGFKNIEIGLFETYYPLELIKSNSLRRLITKLANTKLFWPMIYVNSEKLQRQ